MEQTPTPQRSRRSDRYNQPAPQPETPSSAPVERKVYARPVQPAQPQTSRAAAPQVIQRSKPQGKRMLQSSPLPEEQRKKAEKKQAPVPKVMIAGIVALMLLCIACVAAGNLMQAYLKQQQDAREQAYQNLLDRHPLQYQSLIEKYAAEYNLQPAYVAAIILNESSYNTQAESSVGARGLMQLMPDTAEWVAHKLGLDATYNVDQLWDAETNLRFGCWYLNYLSEMFGGDPVTVTSAYHTGQGEVTGWLSNKTYAPDGKNLSLESMPDGPTKTYAGKVTRDYGIYDAIYFHTFNEATEAS